MSNALQLPERAYGLRTARLELTAWDTSDAPDFHFVHERDKDHLLPSRDKLAPAPSMDEVLERMRVYRGQFDLDVRWRWCVRSLDGELMGGASLRPHEYGALELGWWLAAPALGSGLATEAAAALLHVAFRLHRAPRVEARMDTDHDRSAGVAERIGLVREGTLASGLAIPVIPTSDAWVYGLALEAYESGPHRAVEVHARDVHGQPLSLDRRSDEL